MSDKDQIAALEERVAVLERNLQQMQQQINAMPGAVQKQLQRAASRKL